MKLITSFLILASLAFGGFAHAAPATMILKNQFGEQSNNTVIGGNFGGVGIYLQRLTVTYAQLNTATSGVALSVGTALPDKAIIRQVYYNVRTTFVDNGTSTDADTSTLSIGANTNVDLKAAVTIANGANAWDAGITAGIPVGTAATMVKTTAARNVKVVWTHGSGNSTALTAGVMDIFVEYVYGL